MNTARIGDLCTGICTQHTIPKPWVGTIVTGSANVLCEGMGVARIGDLVVTDCGHTFVIGSCSATVFTNGLGEARIADIVVGNGNGIIVSGSPTRFSG